MPSRSLLTLVCLALALPASAVCTFGLLSETTTPAGTNAGDMATGDFNHDGFDDIAVVNRQSSNIAILLGQQGGTFAAPVYEQTSGANQDDILAAYMNADAHLDLVAMGGSISSYTGTHVQVLLGDGTGNFTLGDSEQVGTYPEALVAGDFDGDNDTDIAVSQDASYPSGFNLLLNNGSGVLTQKSVNQTPETVGIRGIDAGDFDGDGKLDVVVAGGTNRKAWVFFGKGDGTFVTPGTSISVTPSTDHAADYVAVDDFNGDGFDDVAVANTTNASYYPGIGIPPVVLALSNGAGRTFASAVSQYEVEAQDLLAQDMNGDGNADLVIAGSYTNVLLGNGDGTFDGPVSGGGGIRVAILDADNDGGPDIVTSRFSSSSTVALLLNLCGQVTLDLTSSANPASHGNSFTITTSLTSNPAATGTLTLSRTGGTTLGSINLSSGTSVQATQNLPIGTYEYVATYSGDTRFSASTKKLTQTVQTAPFGPPPGLVATSAGGGTATLTWFATSGTQRYEIWRQSLLGTFQVGETTNTFFTDSDAPANAYVYLVRAISPTNVASDSSTDFTVTHSFTDENIVTGSTTVKTAHLTEVRAAANALRQLAGLPIASWTASSVVLAAQFNEVRTAINQARTSLAASSTTFTDTLTQGVSIRGVHMTELRSAMR